MLVAQFELADKGFDGGLVGGGCHFDLKVLTEVSLFQSHVRSQVFVSAVKKSVVLLQLALVFLEQFVVQKLVVDGCVVNRHVHSQKVRVLLVFPLDGRLVRLASSAAHEHVVVFVSHCEYCLVRVFVFAVNVALNTATQNLVFGLFLGLFQKAFV